MARATKVEEIPVILKDYPDGEALIYEHILEDIWQTMRLDYYPAGLDRYLFWTASEVGSATAERWLGLVLGVEGAEGSSLFWVEATKRLRLHPDLSIVIDGISLFHRRRLKAEPGWVDNHPAWVNRLIRAKSRAIKMLGTTAAEVAA